MNEILSSSPSFELPIIDTRLMILQTPSRVFYDLVEETDDLAGNVLAAGLLVVHDTSGGGKDDVTELTGWQKLDNPLLKIGKTDVVSWGDDTGLVETAVKLDDDLAGAVVIDLLELANVTLKKN
jgi:hypothetical protein